MRPLLALTLAAAALAAGCGLRSTEPQAEVHDAWVRLPAVPGGPAAGYFRVEINGARETLMEVSSPSAERIEMHLTEEAEGRTTMRPIPEANTEQWRPLVFEPGARHLMIHGLDPSLRPGDAIRLDFRFALAPPASAEARLVAAGEEPPHPGH